MWRKFKWRVKTVWKESEQYVNTALSMQSAFAPKNKQKQKKAEFPEENSAYIFSYISLLGNGGPIVSVNKGSLFKTCGNITDTHQFYIHLRIAVDEQRGM